MKKYLWRHPKGYIYVRKGKLLERIKAPEGTPEFDREYWESSPASVRSPGQAGRRRSRTIGSRFVGKG